MKLVASRGHCDCTGTVLWSFSASSVSFLSSAFIHPGDSIDDFPLISPSRSSPVSSSCPSTAHNARAVSYGGVGMFSVLTK